MTPLPDMPDMGEGLANLASLASIATDMQQTARKWGAAAPRVAAARGADGHDDEHADRRAAA